MRLICISQESSRAIKTPVTRKLRSVASRQWALDGVAVGRGQVYDQGKCFKSRFLIFMEILCLIPHHAGEGRNGQWSTVIQHVSVELGLGILLQGLGDWRALGQRERSFMGPSLFEWLEERGSLSCGAMSWPIFYWRMSSITRRITKLWKYILSLFDFWKV